MHVWRHGWREVPGTHREGAVGQEGLQHLAVNEVGGSEGLGAGDNVGQLQWGRRGRQAMRHASGQSGQMSGRQRAGSSRSPHLYAIAGASQPAAQAQGRMAGGPARSTVPHCVGSPG